MIFSDYKILRINIEDKIYPKSLKNLANPPKTLYYRGSLEVIKSKCLAIVGSRRITTYGTQVLDKLVPDIVSSGVVIVSGFMYGVDTKAHDLAIENQGKTVAVFGNGLDCIYPPENEKLYTKILETGGAVISEYLPDRKPHLWTYPERNRIVAALSTLGTLVIEAAENSGSLVTAKWARKLKRPLYAVPGQITSVASKGCNELIRNHLATMVLKSSDIVGIGDIKYPKIDIPQMVPLQAKIYQTLLNDSLTLDELCLKLGESVSDVNTQISLMTLQGVIQEINGTLYINTKTL